MCVYAQCVQLFANPWTVTGHFLIQGFFSKHVCPDFQLWKLRAQEISSFPMFTIMVTESDSVPGPCGSKARTSCFTQHPAPKDQH